MCEPINEYATGITPGSLFLTLLDEKPPYTCQYIQRAAICLYHWDLVDFNMLSFFTVACIQSIAKTAPAPLQNCYYIAALNQSLQYQQIADRFIKQQQGLVSEQCLCGGPQGCAMLIQLTENQQAMFYVKDSLPHVVVTVTPGYKLSD